jgi:hypothetical protein
MPCQCSNSRQDKFRFESDKRSHRQRPLTDSKGLMAESSLAFVASFGFVLTCFSGRFIDSIGHSGFVLQNFRFFFFTFLRKTAGLARRLHNPSCLSGKRRRSCASLSDSQDCPSVRPGVPSGSAWVGAMATIHGTMSSPPPGTILQGLKAFCPSLESKRFRAG